MKKLLIALFALLLIFALALPVAGLGEPASGTAEDAAYEGIYEGTYDGEYDANGRRSGYGTWTYHNFVYAGYWENDLPNGEGALYYHLGWEDNGDKIINKYVLEGIWVDGFAEGQVEDTIIKSSGDPIIFRYDVINGCMTSDELISSTDGHTKIMGEIGLLVGCVPPWGDIETDASVPAPSPTFDYDYDILPAPDYHLVTLGDSRVAFQLRYQVVDGNAVITGYQASGGAAINDLTIPAEVDGYPVTAIGESAFEECWRVLDWVILPDGVISIGERAFRGCASIKAFFIPDSVTSIGNEAFAECERLMEATVPTSVTSLGSDVFRNTPLEGMAIGGHAPSGDVNETMRLTYEVVDGNAVITGYEVDNSDIFYNLVIPSELDGYPVTAIGDQAFAECYDLWRVIIPDGVVSIGAGAFRECPNMRSVIIPKSVTTIGIEVFADCWGLETISIPDSVASAGDETGGVYEGEYDENGKRSGFGTWAYYNYLYVGQWENDLPNGEGTLYWRKHDADNNPYGKYPYEEMTHGNWVNGFAEGTVEWTAFEQKDSPSTYRIDHVKRGASTAFQYMPCLNLRKGKILNEGVSVGLVMPFQALWGTVEKAIGTPWKLYEKYPTGKIPFDPLEKLENTGMDITPGNMANQQFSAVGIAQLGDWIFFTTYDEKGGCPLYKMRSDGTGMMKIADNESLYREFHVIGDRLYWNDTGSMRANDVTLTPDTNDSCAGWAGWLGNRVIDDWTYQSATGWDTTSNEEHIIAILSKTKLDFSERIEFGSYERDRRIRYGTTSQLDVILFADEDWVYVFNTNEGEIELSPPDYISQISKVSNNGSCETQNHIFREGVRSLSISMPQIAHNRIYYLEAYDVTEVDGEARNAAYFNYRKMDRVESCVYSVDLDFSETPIALIPRSKSEHVTAFHVTEDAIYYGIVSNEDGRGAIMRADLDGGNPTVVADGFETGYTKLANGLKATGQLYGILIAGDWMIFTEDARKKSTHHMMRLDGSDLHELGEPFVPHDAPGITDSTGKWRYELLPDGSAMILGAGSKLKLSGKLSIPATVDKIPVTAIGENAFYGCEGFTGVSIPKSVTSIGNYAFFWCKGLTGVTVPEGVTSIGEGAFQWCVKVKKVSLPASLTSVGEQAFADCPSAKLSVAKKNEVFEVRDGMLFDKAQDRFVD